MNADAQTLAFYEAQAPRYTMSFGTSPSPHLDAFLNRLPPNARILELGCGGGRDAARMAERRFDVDPTDGSAAMVRKTQERFDLPARRMEFGALDAAEEYDAVWAHASLLHVGRIALPGVLSAIHRALRPEGLHYASYKLGLGEGRDGLGRLHNFPDPEWLLDTYRAAGFVIVDQIQYPGKGADGTMRDWIGVTCAKKPRCKS